MQSGDLWHCTNALCGAELSIGISREIEVDHVYCVCGGVMKKHYTPPVFNYLKFLGERETDLHLPLSDPGLHHARKD
jgi:hypothetical protein